MFVIGLLWSDVLSRISGCRSLTEKAHCVDCECLIEKNVFRILLGYLYTLIKSR